MSKDTRSGPVSIKITGQARGVTITGNKAFGMPLLDAEDAVIHGLTLTFNEVYGAQSDHVVLGEVFGATIAANLFAMEVPKALIPEIKEAAKSPEKRASFLARLTSYLKPSEIEAIAALIERIGKLGAFAT